MSDPATNSNQASSGYEESDARPRPLLLFAMGLSLVVVLSLAVTKWVISSFDDAGGARNEVHPMSSYRTGPEGPVLQAVPASELEAHRAEEERLLKSYGWVDKDNGLARIPIERAMEIVGQRGVENLDFSLPELEEQ